MPYANYTADEVAERGEAIYAAQLRPLVGDRHSQFLVLDIETGDYEIADDDLTATRQLLLRRPDAVIYGLRIGHATAYRLIDFMVSEVRLTNDLSRP